MQKKLREQIHETNEIIKATIGKTPTGLHHLAAVIGMNCQIAHE